MSATGLYTTEELYRLLPAVYRVRDAEQGGASCASCSTSSPSQVNVLAEPRAAVRRRVHRDVRAVGRVVHRRPRRLPDAARRRAAGGVAAGRGREHDPLPAAQGHGLGAGAARRRRHRLAGARGRVLRAARGDAVHEPRPRARGGDDRPAQRGPPRAVGDVPGGRVRHVLAHRRHAPDRLALEALQHPERRHLPLARAGAPARARAARRRRRRRPALPLRPARDRQAAVQRAAHRAGDHAPR